MIEGEEDKLTKATGRAVRAQNLIENELLAEAFDGLEAAYTLAWRSTFIQDVAAREKLFLAINVVGKVRQHLSNIVINGKVAAAELKELAEVAEHEKRHGKRHR